MAPQRGRRRRVLELAVTDAQAVIGRDSLRRQSDHNVRSRALQELGDALGLGQPPFRIECFDMSHLQGTNYVGSMVVFEDAHREEGATTDTSTCKEILGNDDVGAMQEVVRRRLAHLDDSQATTKFRRPDLIIIDGGLPQLHAAQKAAAQVGGHRHRVRRARQARGVAVPPGLVDANLARARFGEPLSRPAHPR